MVTDNILFRVRTHKNPKLQDDDFVQEIMGKMIEKYPQVKTYQYEREDENTILLLIWFNEPVNVIM